MYDDATAATYTFRLLAGPGCADYAEATRLHGMSSGPRTCTICHCTDHTLNGIATALNNPFIRRRRWSELEQQRRAERGAESDAELLHKDAVRASPTPCCHPGFTSLELRQPQTAIHSLVDGAHFRTSIFPIDPLHASGTLCTKLFSDTNVVFHKVFTLRRRGHARGRASMDELSVVWYSGIARAAEEIRCVSSNCFAGNITSSAVEKLGRGVLTTISRAKAIMMGTALFLRRIIGCREHAGRGTLGARCTKVCVALHCRLRDFNITLHSLLMTAVESCDSASAIVCMSSSQLDYDWLNRHSFTVYHIVARKLITSWIELHRVAEALTVLPEHLTSKGGTARLRTIHGLLVEVPFLRQQLGDFLSSSVFEKSHSATKSAVQAVQAVKDDQVFGARLLTEITSKLVRSVATDMAAAATASNTSTGPPVVKWVPIHFMLGSDFEHSQISLPIPHHRLCHVIVDALFQKLRAASGDLSEEQAKAKARVILDRGTRLYRGGVDDGE